MADEPKKDDDVPAAGNGNGSGAGHGSGSTADAALNERLNTVLLAIIEREIGRGEPRSEEDWRQLREMAIGHAQGPQLVDSFEEVLDRANREMLDRFGAPGMDLARIRGSVVTLIRDSLAKKLGLAPGGVKES